MWRFPGLVTPPRIRRENDASLDDNRTALRFRNGATARSIKDCATLTKVAVQSDVT
jgi:hypothetical protein